MDKKQKNINDTFFNQHKITSKLQKKILPKIPKFINSIHMTLASLFWGVLCLMSAVMFYQTQNINWLWLNVVGSLGHVVTDNLDGALGRYRNEGLINWGYLMDHYLDFFVTTCQFVSVSTLFYVKKPEIVKYLLIGYPLIVSLFVISFLSTDDDGMDIVVKIRNNISFSPMEILLMLITMNSFFIIKEGDINEWLFILMVIGLAIANTRKLYGKQKEFMKKDLQKKLEKLKAKK